MWRAAGSVSTTEALGADGGVVAGVVMEIRQEHQGGVLTSKIHRWECSDYIILYLVGGFNPSEKYYTLLHFVPEP